MNTSKKKYPYIEASELTRVHTTGFNYKQMDNDMDSIHIQYLLLNRLMPNSITFTDIDAIALFNDVIEHYKILPSNIYTEHTFYESTRNSVINNRIVFLKRDMIMLHSNRTDNILFFYGNTCNQEYIQEWVELFANYFGVYNPGADTENGNIWILRQERMSGLKLEPFIVPLPEMSIDTHYNNDFSPVHNYVLQRLQTINDNGLVLLHGAPGTGKTTYLRYLSGKLNKKLIYINRQIANNLLSINFITFMLDHPNSILVIEDAEDIITHNNERTFSISSLLNIADGLLSDCLNLQVICTFNTHIRNIDKALLRKGRLIALYEFKALKKDKANKLSVDLGSEPVFTEDATLAQIYNQNTPDYQYQRSGKIGF